MICCGNSDEGSKKSRELDRQIREDRIKQDGEIKLLLLGWYLFNVFGWTWDANISDYQGAGESGKSTFAKQMKILHMNGFDETERTSFRLIIRKNILHSLETILSACDYLGIRIEPDNEVYTTLYNTIIIILRST